MVMSSSKKGPGKRHNIWIPERYAELWAEIENNSKFVQLALDQAAGIIAWGLLKKENPDKYALDETPEPEELKEFNEAFPLDPLTKQRIESSPNSANKPELW